MYDYALLGAQLGVLGFKQPEISSIVDVNYILWKPLVLQESNKFIYSVPLCVMFVYKSVYC